MQRTEMQPTICSTTREHQGRIPAPQVISPISAERFASLAGRWRECGVWLTLWNGKGQMVRWDEQAPQFWHSLGSRRNEWAASLGESVQRVIRSASTSPAGISGEQRSDENHEARNIAPIRLDCYQPDLMFFVVPVVRRRSVLGAVVAGFVTSDLRGEDFVRLCNSCGLDHSAMLGFSATVPRWTPDSVSTTARLLRLTVEQAGELDVACEESAVLTQNLENTYEELNLIYRISANMSLPQKPQVMLARVGLQVTAISRAAVVAFVLSEQDTDGADRNVPGALSTNSLVDRVVQVNRGSSDRKPGSAGVKPIDLLRLAETLQLDPVSTPHHLLINSAPSRPELNWTSDWLEHLVALPLWHHEKLLGVMLAINCNDGGDFTSVDVQLFRAVADRLTAFLENQRLYDDLADLLMGLLHAVVNSVDAKDPYTYGHSERVAYLSRALARAAKLTPTECERVYLAGLMHDVGKIGVPDAVLTKPGKLTPEEFETLKKHPEIGVRILSPVRQMRDLLPGVLYHHERMDGRGYPEQLAGDGIPLLGRIICLADCFDAMTTNRTYRAALPIASAISEVRRCAGTQFDPRLASLFLELDLERLFHEARTCIGQDATMAHIGALHAVLDRQITQ